MKKVLVVYNSRSSRRELIENGVLAEARKLRGYMVGRFEVKTASLDENANKLAKLVNDGDLVIVAGGDGTATMAANGVLLSGKQVVLGVLGYGNFNDMGRMVNGNGEVSFSEIVKGFEEQRILDVWPLEVKVDGKHWRFAVCYTTIGLLAEATELMDDEKVRRSLNTGKRGPLYSLRMAVGWYLKNRKRDFLPAGMRLNDELVPKGTTDYLAVNGPTLARLMKGGGWYLESGDFGSTTGRLGRFWRMVRFGLRSVFLGVKLVDTKGDVIRFDESANVEIQAEGEYRRLEGVREIEIKKASRALKVVRLR